MSQEVTPPGQLRREHILNPITALTFLTFRERLYLLAGEDTLIKVFNVETKQLISVVSVFHTQPIHGVSVTPAAEDNGNPNARVQAPRILVWGTYSIKLLSAEALILGSVNSHCEEFGSVDSAPGAVAPDWIFDGRVSPFDDDRVVLLTAHNEVIEGRVAANRETIVLERVRSPSRPILYSGNIFWAARDCVLVAAGTAFGEIVVWKCHLHSGVDDNVAGGFQDMKTSGCEVLFVFSGHQGSIFGVCISPEILTSSGEAVRLLASCSDDRTIRIWDITERRHGNVSGDHGYETQISDARQTGFGDSIVDPIGLVNSHSKCVAMVMGHVSRIWQVQIHTQTLLSSGGIEVYSFGEDATVQKWHLGLESLELSSRASTIGAINNSDHPPVQLTHIETFSNHNGKHIWSHAMIDSIDGLLIASGGGDGKISLMSHDSAHALSTSDDAMMQSECSPRSVEEITVSPENLIEYCQHHNPGTAPSVSTFKHGNGREMFQSFTFITENKLLITTRSGRIFIGSFGSKTEWSELSIPDTVRTTIQSYTILRGSTKVSTAFIGATNGELFLFYYDEANGGSLRSIHKAERKIVEIICLSDTRDTSSRTSHDHDRPDEYIEILVMVFGSRRAELLRLDQNRSIVKRIEVKLPVDFIVTSAGWCHNYLVLGSRNGCISIYDLAMNDGRSPLLTIEAAIGDKVTSILPLPRRSESSPPYFLTTARDGKYRIYEISNAMSNFRVCLLHETNPPFGPLIEGSWLFDQPNGKQSLMLCGFRGKDFVVWNATQQKEIATFDCGGGHRVFVHAQIRGNPEGLRFACTKASQMKIFSQIRAPHLALKIGGHGREIKAVAASGNYVATGAEDTMIRIWELCRGRGKDRGEQEMRCVLVLERHNTGIQKLKWYKDQYLFSSGGNEEFFSWRITALESDVSPLGIVCEAVFPDRSVGGDLRITDFDVHRVPRHAGIDEEAKEISIEPENSRLEPPIFCISMALSNSSMQSYLYSAQYGFRLLGRRTYTGACLTQLRHLGFTNQCHPQVLTAATDGQIAIFADMRAPEDGTEKSKGIVSTKLHQSTAKSLDMRSIVTETGTSYLVVTGGDDNAIGVQHISSSSSGISTSGTQQAPRRRYVIRNKFIIRKAHAAAITGLGILRFENGGRDAVIVTASNDQRIKTWRLVGWQSPVLRMFLLDNQYSGIADAGDLEMVGEDGGRRVLVAGLGIETWRVA
ncbi:WD40-repeat-containing domain protein [Xylaria nigripes]|nr:WD40-repeat-containing domain protein [Xylaria nigripes]